VGRARGVAGRADPRALGAIAGLDGLKGAAVDGHLDTIVMETRKPPRGLAGAPGVSGLDLTAITAPTLFFEGTAREACRAFPANVNVVAAVSLAGLGPDRTCSRIHADPSIDRNRRTVTPRGRVRPAPRRDRKRALRPDLRHPCRNRVRAGRRTFLRTNSLTPLTGALADAYSW
jgi:hypothetical protein